MRTAAALLFIVCALVLSACGSNSKILEQGPADSAAIMGAKAFHGAIVNFKWSPPKDGKDKEWKSVTGEEWQKQRETLSQAFNQAAKDECGKEYNILKLDDKPAEGVRVECTVLEMSKGGWGGTGNATAEVTLVDIKSGKPIYKAKIEGNSRNAGYEGNAFWGRLKYSMMNIGYEVAKAIRKGAK
jgi:hypothetical protein